MKNIKTLTHFKESWRDIFVVNWALGNVCNYSCSYCPKEFHTGKSWTAYKNIINFCDKIIDQVPKEKNIHFDFTGGEVSMWKHLIDACKHIKSATDRTSIGIISNGSRTIRWWTEAVPYLDKVNLSFHSEFAKKEHFVEVVKFLSDKTSLHVNMMMSHKNFELCKEVFEELKQIDNISIDLQPLFKNLLGGGEIIDEYTPEQMEYINHNGKRDGEIQGFAARGDMRIDYEDGEYDKMSGAKLIGQGMNNFKNMMCSAGVEQISVESAGGWVFRCWSIVGGVIGNIRDKNFKLPKDMIKCDKDKCFCNSDITCTKIKH